MIVLIHVPLIYLYNFLCSYNDIKQTENIMLQSH